MVSVDPQIERRTAAIGDHRGLMPDLDAATRFLAAHGRLLDRRRHAYATGTADASSVLAALDAYRNPDGGYGWGLEPDLRSVDSQPAAALHAFEAMAEVGTGGDGHATAL